MLSTLTVHVTTIVDDPTVAPSIVPDDATTPTSTETVRPRLTVPPGTGTPGETVTILSGDTVVGTGVVGGDGGFVIRVNLSDGPHLVTYTFTDPVGNVSARSPVLNIEVNSNFGFDSINNQADTDEDDEEETLIEQLNPSAFQRRDVLLSHKIESLAPEPILSGSAKPGTVLVGRVYDSSGALIGEATATASGAGNWVMNFYGVPSSNNTRIVIEHVATEEVAIGDASLSFSDETYRSLQLDATGVKATTAGTILSDSPDASLLDIHKQNLNPLHLL